MSPDPRFARLLGHQAAQGGLGTLQASAVVGRIKLEALVSGAQRFDLREQIQGIGVHRRIEQRRQRQPGTLGILLQEQHACQRRLQRCIIRVAGTRLMQRPLGIRRAAQHDEAFGLSSQRLMPGP